MALPAHLQETFSPEEIQFLVEDEMIKIFPRITTRQRRRKIGNGHSDIEDVQFRMVTTEDDALNQMVAMRSTEVKLWIALLLKQQSKCSIVAPSWLTVKELNRKIQYEKTATDRFSDLPWNWIVVANLLFSRAADDFHDPVHELRSKIQDLREIRQTKVLRGLKQLNASHLQLDNLSLLEINELRPFIVRTMDKLRDVHDAANIDGTVGEEDEYDDVM
ncbi:DNA replication protein PSF2 [Nakaseomyces bracarensis]|uniref:DNA replication protein PSF2 n=1 Tax=Nakaseomyces bracarensis TaxID=273131 RepID=UPI0038720B01